MATISVTSNAAQVGRKFARFATQAEAFKIAAPAEIADVVRPIVSKYLYAEAPKVTSDLAASQTSHVVLDTLGARILWGSDAPYAGFVLHGTGIYFDGGGHSAWDVDGFQAFQVNGTRVYAMHTHHEGQKPNDWPGRAFTRAVPEVLAAVHLIDGRLFARFL